MAERKTSSKSSGIGLSFSFDKEDEVTLLVGPDEHAILAHGNYISRRSDFFKAALKKEWVEGQTRTIKLPDECPEVTSHYLNYTYSQQLPTTVFDKSFLGTFEIISDEYYELLADLYVMGERMLNDAIKAAIIEEFLRLIYLRDKSDKQNFPTQAAANTIYSGTMPNSAARRLMVDVHVSFGLDKWLDAGCEAALVLDIAQDAFAKTKSYTTYHPFSEPRRVVLEKKDYMS